MNRGKRFEGRTSFAMMLVIAVGTLSGCITVTSHFEATLTPAVPGYSAGALRADASTIDHRLSQLGYPGGSAHVQGHDIVVASAKPITNLDLQALGTEANLQVRPVLCFAGPLTRTHAMGTLPTGCSASQYTLVASNLNVDVTTGQPTNTVQPDPVLSAYPSSTAEFNTVNPQSVVLLPAALNEGQGISRYLLGPAGLTNAAIQTADAEYVPDTWLVDLTLTSTGAGQWDALAQQQFHAYVAIDLDGQVLSAPLTEPNTSTFFSLGGKVQVSGNFTKASAQTLAAELNSGPLAVPLESPRRKP